MNPNKNKYVFAAIAVSILGLTACDKDNVVGRDTKARPVWKVEKLQLNRTGGETLNLQYFAESIAEIDINDSISVGEDSSSQALAKIEASTNCFSNKKNEQLIRVSKSRSFQVFIYELLSPQMLFALYTKNDVSYKCEIELRFINSFGDVHEIKIPGKEIAIPDFNSKSKNSQEILELKYKGLPISTGLSSPAISFESLNQITAEISNSMADKAQLVCTQESAVASFTRGRVEFKSFNFKPYGKLFNSEKSLEQSCVLFALDSNRIVAIAAPFTLLQTAPGTTTHVADDIVNYRSIDNSIYLGRYLVLNSNAHPIRIYMDTQNSITIRMLWKKRNAIFYSDITVQPQLVADGAKLNKTTKLKYLDIPAGANITVELYTPMMDRICKASRGFQFVGAYYKASLPLALKVAHLYEYEKVNYSDPNSNSIVLLRDAFEFYGNRSSPGQISPPPNTSDMRQLNCK